MIQGVGIRKGSDKRERGKEGGEEGVKKRRGEKIKEKELGKE